MRKNKYNAKKTVVDGITFDSKKEASRWLELKLLERSGKISDLKRQVPIDLMGGKGPVKTKTGRKMKLTFDFSYVENGLLILEDSKGFPTRDYEVRVAVVKADGHTVRET